MSSPDGKWTEGKGKGQNVPCGAGGVFMKKP